MRHLLLLLCWVVVWCYSAPVHSLDGARYEAEAERLGSANELLELTSKLLAQAKQEFADLGATDCKTMANVLGVVVEKLNALQSGEQWSTQAHQLGAEITSVCRNRVRSLESHFGDDEVALERFYKSEDWYSYNYVFSGVRYWQAWLDFGLAKYSDGKSERIEALSKAERGFQMASMRIHYPSTVYGSWWGLANVALEREQYDKAEQRLQLLKQAIASGSQLELTKLVDNELKLLTIKQGRGLHDSLVEGEPIVSDQARFLVEEAFVLLEQQRRKETGRVDAAIRLKQVIAAGHYDDALIARILSYKEEIVGQDIGVLSFLVEAEYAYDYQKYNTVVLKYREFRRSGGESLLQSAKFYQYHFVVGLFNTELSTDALIEIKQLLSGEALEPNLLMAASKLYFSIAAQVYLKNANNTNRKDYIASARMFIENSVQDSVDQSLGLAWSVLAKFEEDKAKSDHYFQTASQYEESTDNVNYVRYQKLAARFHEAYTADDKRLKASLANEGQAIFSSLSRELKKAPIVKAQNLQFSAAITADTTAALSRIEILRGDNIQNTALLKILFRAKLILHDRNEPPKALPQFITDEINKQPTYWMLDELFKMLVIKDHSEDLSDIANLAAALAPAFAKQPVNQRYLLRLQIRGLIANNNNSLAFDLADELVHKYPNSGDAWKLYAIAAERLKNDIEADRAWAKLAKSVPKGSPQWLQYVLKRTALNSRRDVAEACSLLASAGAYKHLMETDIENEFRLWMKNINCQNEYSGSV